MSSSPTPDPQQQTEVDLELLEDRAVAEAVGRVVIQSVAVESAVVACVMAAGCDPLLVWGQSGGDLRRIVRGLGAPPTAQASLDTLVDEYHRLYQKRNHVIHGFVDKSNGKSLKMKRPKNAAERKALAEAAKKDSRAGWEESDASLSDLHNLANEFIMLGRSALTSLFELQVAANERRPGRAWDLARFHLLSQTCLEVQRQRPEMVPW